MALPFRHTYRVCSIHTYAHVYNNHHTQLKTGFKVKASYVIQENDCKILRTEDSQIRMLVI